MQRPRHRYQAKSLRFSQRRYELQNRPCRIRLFSEKQIGPINRWGHGLLHGTNHGVKDSNFESKIPSGFYGSFTKTRSQKYIYSYSCSQRSNFKEAEKAKTFTALLCFWKTFSKSLWPKKKKQRSYRYLYIYIFSTYEYDQGLKEKKKKYLGYDDL